MTSKFNTVVCSFLLLGFAGCQMAHKDTSGYPVCTTVSLTGGPQESAKRFVAVRHKRKILPLTPSFPKHWSQSSIFAQAFSARRLPRA
jgi:hypothetical protein